MDTGCILAVVVKLLYNGLVFNIVSTTIRDTKTTQPRRTRKGGVTRFTNGILKL